MQAAAVRAAVARAREARTPGVALVAHAAAVGAALPRPERSAGHAGSSHAAPCQPAAQGQAPSSHTPWPEQSPTHAGAAQSGPLHPASHSQCVPPTHLPWLEQPAGHSRSPQSAPT